MAALATSLFLDAGQLIAQVVTAVAPQPDVTKVNILVGHSDTDNTLGGNAPYVSIYDNFGTWMGTHQPGERKKIWDQGSTVESGTGGIDIKHSTVFKHEHAASYILLSNCDSNAICIAQIGIADLSISTSWTGDLGMHCGMPWYASNLAVGGSRRTPKCVWLDGDNTNGLPQAMSFQIDAFADSPDKVTQYRDNKDTLCKSTPRFSTWQDLDWNSPIPIFDPPLKYEVDSVTGGQGRDKDLGKIVDSDDCKYDKGKERYLKDLDQKCKDKGIGRTGFPPGRFIQKSPNRRQERPQRPEGTIDLRRRFAGQLVVSSMSSHNATELCDSKTSFGPDFVSTEEGVFCSMSQKKTFPLCGHDGASTQDICFDLEAGVLVTPNSEDTAHAKRIREELPVTNYSFVRRWQDASRSSQAGEFPQYIAA